MGGDGRNVEGAGKVPPQSGTTDRRNDGLEGGGQIVRVTPGG